MGHQVGLRDLQGPDPAGFRGHGEYSAVYHKDMGELLKCVGE